MVKGPGWGGGGGGGGGLSFRTTGYNLGSYASVAPLADFIRTVASSLDVVRPYCVAITTTPTLVYLLIQVPHTCGTAMAVPAL